MKFNMVYIQSGGPTSVINSSLYGAIKEAKLHPEEIDHIYGSMYGIEGLINDNLIDISLEDDEQIELLVQTPGAILGTTRRKLPRNIHDPIYQKIIDNIEKHNIKYVLINGGNDSMDTCHKISELSIEMGLDLRVIGVPKTIDNDLACTDHSLGFPSAAKFVINAVNSIASDAQCYRNGKIYIVEVMGRNAGWLTASLDLLPEDVRPDLIYLPENPFNLDSFIKNIGDIYEKRGFAMAAVSEGIQFSKTGTNVRLDSFGHAQLGGVADELCHIVEEELNVPTRSVEFSLTQRAFPLLTSKIDRDEAIKIGSIAVLSALNGESGKMVVVKRISSTPYRVEFLLEDVGLIANHESVIPQDMMLDDTRMSDKFREYMKPLIQGEVEVKFSDGISLNAKFKKIKVN